MQAHEKGLKVWGLVDNFNENMSTTEVLSKTSSRQNLENQLITYALKAGLDGINKKIYPTKSSSRELSETDQKTMKIENLPGNLNEAIDYFEQSDWIKEVLGTEFCKEYAAAKKKEWLRYTREISAWEIEEYLYRI